MNFYERLKASLNSVNYREPKRKPKSEPRSKLKSEYDNTDNADVSDDEDNKDDEDYLGAINHEDVRWGAASVSAITSQYVWRINDWLAGFEEEDALEYVMVFYDYQNGIYYAVLTNSKTHKWEEHEAPKIIKLKTTIARGKKAFKNFFSEKRERVISQGKEAFKAFFNSRKNL